MMFSPSHFQQKILCWFDQHGRKNLPWQQHKTPYRVWLSEIMLQQTQVSTVIPYFERFVAYFPDVASLAQAEENTILHLWTGLGYYSRARNLYRSAQLIMTNFNGVFPDNLPQLQTLPGIGRSTAGAILSLAFEKSAAILDGNVKRVLTRILGITAWPGEKKIVDTLWETAEKLTPQQRIGDYTQAMMDLGATVCIRRKPHCSVCPVNDLCKAYALGIENTLPHPKPKKILPLKQTTFLILQHEKQVLLQKRPPLGIWGGLFSLPELPGILQQKELKQHCKQQFDCDPVHFHFAPSFRHTFSHFHLDIFPVFISIFKKPLKIMDSEQQIWYNLEDSQVIGLPAPVKKLLRNLA